ncbi:MAG: prephenate dehydrogenase [Thermovirgaceae bacterium]
MRLENCDVAIAGVGLIGGSIAAALVSSGRCRSVRGWDRDPEVTNRAVQNGFLHEALESLEDLAAGADVFVAAVPPEAIAEVGSRAFSASGGRIRAFFDTGSAKRVVAGELARVWRDRYLGFHPMAGSERGGIENADGGLFEGCVTALVTVPETSRETKDTAAELAAVLKCSKTVEMDPQTHDKTVACISHLPVFVAMALSLAAGECQSRLPALGELAAGGFRDTSRVAQGPSWLVAQMWDQNGDNIAPLLHRAASLLETMAVSSKGELAVMSERAALSRKSVLEGLKDSGGELS